ncbi:hypothetical protein [Egbenema bharatensis]|uniref:hypothetical protein n=1 Tax=Egbenema bharatensis TaxID=3463334 RepID=UPI003A8B3D93
MTRILLLGIVTIAIFVIAPRVGATRSVKVDPDQTSPLVARTIFDAELENVEAEDVADRRRENVESGRVEERRDDARRWAEEN